MPSLLRNASPQSVGLIKTLSANLSLEHPKRNAVLWANVIASNDYDIVALQECLNEDGSNFGEQIKAHLPNAVEYVSLHHKDPTGICSFDGDQILFMKRNLFNLIQDPERKHFLGVKSVHLSNTPNITMLLRNETINFTEVYALGYESRHQELKPSLEEMSVYANAIIFGDFNEPSHLDAQQQQPRDYYASTEMRRHGYVDVYHHLHRDADGNVAAATDFGATYPFALYDDDPRERIDFIYCRGLNLQIVSCKRIDTDLSDHCALEATFILHT